MRYILLAIFIYLSMAPAVAQELPVYEKRMFVHRGDTLPYRVLLPENYDPNGNYPILFFLHGAGERGNDNEKQLTHGSTLFINDTVRREFPAIIVFPQCPSDSYWSNVDIQEQPDGRREFYFSTRGKPSTGMRLFLRLVRRLKKEEAVDPQRMYIGGLSMGGMGTYEALRRKPKWFAAAFAICGGDNTANVAKYAHVPLWIFHGEQDDVVPARHSMVIIQELEREGATPKSTFYPDAGHNSWDAAFAEPDLLPWLFSHRKK